MKKTKLSFAVLALIIVVCAALLTGTTYAWFSSSIASVDNSLEVGSLEIEALLLDADGNFNAAPAAPIFNRSNWEPGMLDSAVFKITNTGSLPVNLELRLVPRTQIETPTAVDGVVEVYSLCLNGSDVSDSDIITEPASTEALVSYTRYGSLADVLNGNNVVAGTDSLASGETVYITVSLSLPASLDNTYQNLDGDNFDISVRAAQIPEA